MGRAGNCKGKEGVGKERSIGRGNGQERRWGTKMGMFLRREREREGKGWGY